MLRGPAATLLLLLFMLDSNSGNVNLEVGEPCAASYRSNCQLPELCLSIQPMLDSGQMTPQMVQSCGFTTYGEKICCPVADDEGVISTTTTTTSTTTSTTTRATSTTTTSTTESPNFLPNLDSIFNTRFEYVQTNNRASMPSSSNISGSRSGSSDSSSSTSALQTGASGFVYPGRSSSSIGSTCQAPLYKGQCLPVSQCLAVDQLIDQQRLRAEDVPNCQRGLREEIICCPPALPLMPRDNRDRDPVSTPTRFDTQATTASVGVEDAFAANATALLPHYPHLAALAYSNDNFDGYEHRCTALVLTSQLLLTAASCAPDGLHRPNHAVFGIADLSEGYEEHSYLVDVGPIARYGNDLALLRLKQPLLLGQAPANVSVAPLCSHYDQTRLLGTAKLHASAWAISNSSDCAFYEQPMHLLQATACLNVPNPNHVLGLSAAHVCVAPLAQAPADSCVQCLARVGSVLHMSLSDGSQCVVGVATPTGAACDAQQLYYTSLLDESFTAFIAQQVRETHRGLTKLET